MKGKVTRADGVPGESAGQHVKRTWIFNSKCNQGACYRVVLHKHRSGGHIDKLVLQRTSPGVYSGDGHFYFPIRCAGVIDDHGGEALFTVKVRIVGTRLVQGKPFASKLSAKYENPQRINHTECQGRSLGQDGARYTGSARDLPGPPKARFRRTSTTGRTLKFEDRSTRGSGNAPLRSRSWDFGDPASGAQDTSTGSRPSHTFTAAGTYTVTLTVTDRNGLSASVSHPYTVP
ncbi:MAG: PKD domain-containing protein [Actinobacteria bacterium]|nr:PKD domain-containing protein [Actinomycetota bacterium]